MTDSKRFQRTAQIFDHARHVGGKERSAYLDSECAGDPVLRAEVDALLRHHDAGVVSPGADGPEAAIRSAAADWLSGAGEADAAPEQIGQYAIIRKIGEGGMGCVYEAQQGNPSRRVAVKMIRSGARSPQALKRFQREANLLGELQHVGIAQIFEAGTTSTEHGEQPFFAMEYVRGEPLTRYAQSHDLSPTDRLDLFARVCDAVGYAHERGVIHRDLKPSNILVDASGQPKVLDFGVARAVDADLNATTLQTDIGQLIGTLPYMSPEQVAADPAAVDQRSDVYALGVILFELLSGELPYEVPRHSIVEAARVIQTVEPTGMGSLSRAFRGDIDTIVAKALSKEKQRRYATAEGLADDIRRYLSDEPIVARPPSATYQIRKFAKRNKAVVIGVFAVLAALMLGLIGTSVGLVQATRAQREALAAKSVAETRQHEAERQTRIAEAVNEFLNKDLLSAVDPRETDNPDITMREVLAAAALRIDTAFPGEPLVEAAVRVTLGRLYRNLGDMAAAETQLTRAVELRKQHLGESHNDTLKALNHLAILYDSQGRFDQSEPIYQAALEIRRRELGPDHPDTLSTANNLAVVYQDTGRMDEAEQLHKQVYEARRRLLGEEHADTLVSMNNLASAYWDLHKYAEAEPLNVRVVGLRRKLHGENDPRTLASMDNLATTYTQLGKLSLAETLTLDVLERARKTLDPDHEMILRAINNLASVYARQGKLEEAEKMFAEAAATLAETRGQQHWMRGVALCNQGVCLKGLHRYDESERLLLESHRVLTAALGESHPRARNSAQALYNLYTVWEKREQAERWKEKMGEPQ